MIPILCITIVFSALLANMISALWPQVELDTTLWEDIAESVSKETHGASNASELEIQTQSGTNLGQYKLTAYCPCEKCCGVFATHRPLDKEGQEIVYTANGSVAEEGYTIAADTNILPFGTLVKINGHVYQVQDRGGAITGNHIDLYFNSHQDALNFGVQYADIVLV